MGYCVSPFGGNRPRNPGMGSWNLAGELDPGMGSWILAEELKM